MYVLILTGHNIYYGQHSVPVYVYIMYIHVQGYRHMDVWGRKYGCAHAFRRNYTPKNHYFIFHFVYPNSWWKEHQKHEMKESYRGTRKPVPLQTICFWKKKRIFFLTIIFDSVISCFLNQTNWVTLIVDCLKKKTKKLFINGVIVIYYNYRNIWCYTAQFDITGDIISLGGKSPELWFIVTPAHQHPTINDVLVRYSNAHQEFCIVNFLYYILMRLCGITNHSSVALLPTIFVCFRA